jgi:peptide-methionine (S)-S-oxide reductase
MGGEGRYPRYEVVCRGDTGHVEVVQVRYDPTVINYEMLVRVFFSSHDPTTLNQQGADRGTQYASVIFVQSDDERQIATAIKDEIDADHIRDDPLVTRIDDASEFWLAEGYHQDFYNQNQTKPYCQIVINPKLEKLKKEWEGHLI